jgi:DltD protein
MKRFITRGLCFALIGLALLCVLNSLYVRTNGYKSLDNRYKFYSIPDSIDVINLGSSHGERGFSYEGIEGISGFNAAMGGQNFYYDSKFLQKFCEKLSPSCTVIIPISYFSFMQARDYGNQRLLYYRFFDYGSIQNHHLTEYIQNKLLPIVGASLNIKYIVDDKPAIEFQHIGGILRADDVEGYRQSAESAYQYFLKVRGQGGNEGFNTENLEGILGYCQEHGFKPVLVTTPFTKYYNEEFSSGFFSDFYARINRISSQYGVSYLDYSHDPRFTDHLEFFVDSSHLNQAGQEAFTRIVLSDSGVIVDQSSFQISGNL